MKDIIKTVLIFLIATFGVSQKCDELLRSTKKNPVMKMYTGSFNINFRFDEFPRSSVWPKPVEKIYLPNERNIITLNGRLLNCIM